MPHDSIKRAIEAADRAITQQDFDTLMAFYADDAALVIKPGLIARGKDHIRKAFIAISAHFGNKLLVKQGEMQIIQGANTALVIMQTILETIDADGLPLSITRRATYVFREEPTGQWLCVIDNSYGTDLLGQT